MQRVEAETRHPGSPRTGAKYLCSDGPVRTPDPKQRWLTFVHNHARVMVAADFFVEITATFCTLYVFVILELRTRRILHYNITAHPTAEWTLQQFREALPADHSYRFAIHDRDSIFSKELDKAVTELGVRVLRTPVRAPKGNSVCERFGGRLRRECLDFLIPLKLILKPWVAHFNHGRPHGMPEPLHHPPPEDGSRHSLAAGHVIRSKPVLGGLHHEYWKRRRREDRMDFLRTTPQSMENRQLAFYPSDPDFREPQLVWSNSFLFDIPGADKMLDDKKHSPEIEFDSFILEQSPRCRSRDVYVGQ